MNFENACIVYTKIKSLRFKGSGKKRSFFSCPATERERGGEGLPTKIFLVETLFLLKRVMATKLEGGEGKALVALKNIFCSFLNLVHSVYSLNLDNDRPAQWTWFHFKQRYIEQITYEQGSGARSGRIRMFMPDPDLIFFFKVEYESDWT